MKSSVLEFSHEHECKLRRPRKSSGHPCFFSRDGFVLCVFVPEYAERVHVHVVEVSVSVHRNYLMTKGWTQYWMFVVRVRV